MTALKEKLASNQMEHFGKNRSCIFHRIFDNVTWDEFLTTKFGLWIDTRLSTDNTLHGSVRAVEKSGILLQIEKAPEASNGDLTCYVFSLEDAVAHLSITDPSGILTIEKYGSINMGAAYPLEWGIKL